MIQQWHWWRLLAWYWRIQDRINLIHINDHLYLLAVSVYASALPLLSALLPLFRRISSMLQCGNSKHNLCNVWLLCKVFAPVVETCEVVLMEDAALNEAQTPR